MKLLTLLVGMALLSSCTPRAVAEPFATELNQPRGMALDGKISVFAELPGMPPLAGLEFGPDGRLYVTDFSALPHALGSGAI